MLAMIGLKFKEIFRTKHQGAGCACGNAKLLCGNHHRLHLFPRLSEFVLKIRAGFLLTRDGVRWALRQPAHQLH